MKKMGTKQELSELETLRLKTMNKIFSAIPPGKKPLSLREELEVLTRSPPCGSYTEMNGLFEELWKGPSDEPVPGKFGVIITNNPGYIQDIERIYVLDVTNGGKRALIYSNASLETFEISKRANNVWGKFRKKVDTKEKYVFNVDVCSWNRGVNSDMPPL